MAIAVHHLSVGELEERVRGATSAIERSHCQAIWLLAKGHATADVAAVTALSPRWVAALARRYEQQGPSALGDRRRGNRGGKALLSGDDLDALRERLGSPPDDGGMWTGPKVAAWMAARLGLAHVHAPRGWEALKKLGFSIQVPRPKNPRAATPEAEEAFKKSLRTRPPRKRRPVPARRSRSGRPTSTGSVSSRCSAGSGRPSASGPSPSAITVSSGSMSPLSCIP